MYDFTISLDNLGPSKKKQKQEASFNVFLLMLCDSSSFTGKHLSLAHSDQPTMKECVAFQGKERIINFSKEIGTNYQTFGKLLLGDNTGALVDSVAHKHSGDLQRINTEIFEQWITGKGKHPVTWRTLTQVLRDVGLTVLAGEIEAIKCEKNETGKH